MNKYDGGLVSNMSLRDKFALSYAERILADPAAGPDSGDDITDWLVILSFESYEFADAMLVARAEVAGEEIQ